MNNQSETTEQRIRRVAAEITDLLVKNRLVMLPTISLQEVKEKKEEPLITPEPPSIKTLEDIEKERAADPFLNSDLMKP